VRRVTKQSTRARTKSREAVLKPDPETADSNPQAEPEHIDQKQIQVGESAMTTIDINQIRSLAPRVTATYVAAFSAPSANAILTKYGIAASPLRVCHFFAQILEETGDFRALVESLNYSVAQMMKVWPKRFPTSESAAPYAGDEEKLANYVYGNRKDLGNDMPGDGYLFRGRGLLQITGRDAYTRFGKLLGIDLVGNPGLATDPAHCLEIAAAEYSSTSIVRNGKRLTCNDLADLDDITTITRLVNGGLTNLDQRKAELARCKQVWPPSASAAHARGQPAPPQPGYGAVHTYTKRAGPARPFDAAHNPYFKRRKAILGARVGEQPKPWNLRDLCQAYRWPTAAPGTGIIAIVELGGGYDDADIDAFRTKLGIPSPKIENVSVDAGAANNPGQSRGQLDDPDVEVTMDIEVAAAAYSLATGKQAQIRMYWVENQPGRIAAAVRAAAQDGCDVCSISWGADEADWRAWGGGTDQYFADMEAAAQAAGRAGMTVFAASGDNDSSDGGPFPANVDLPSSAPSVIGCGGTTKLSSNEVVWNEKPHMSDGNGTGGGYSKETVPPPDWQVGIPPNSKGATGRMVPDVAANADPGSGYQLYIHGADCVYGGTSAVAPLYAGLFAALGNKLGFISPNLWKDGRDCFVDITQGDNGDYQAAVGPDPCSGLGVPIGTALAKFVSQLAPGAADVSQGNDITSTTGGSHAIAVDGVGTGVLDDRLAAPYNSANALAFGQLINQAYSLYAESTRTGNLTPTPGDDFPKNYRLTAWVLMDDFFFSKTGPTLYGFIAQNLIDPTRSVLALRGTQGWIEWFDNATSVFHVPFKTFTDCGTISYGFGRIYETLQIVEASAQAGVAMARAAPRSLTHVGGFAAQVAAHVRGVGARDAAVGAPPAPKVLDIAGHSLGGALATLFTLENAKTTKLETSILYTFASPRVGDATFAAAVDGLGITSWRVVNLQDAVPKLPPELLGYQHIGVEKDYDSTGQVQANDVCFHSLQTYLHLIDPAQPLECACMIDGAAADAAFALAARDAASAPAKKTLAGRSIYVFKLDEVLSATGSTDAMVEKAVKAKISSIWVKIAESATPSANVLHGLGNQFHDLVAKCAAKGIDVFGWHVPYCTDASRTDSEVKLLTRLVDDFQLAGVVIDNEDGAAFFKGNATTAAQYAVGLRRAMQAAGKLVVMSSLDIVSYHPGAYATVIGESIDVNAPQVYYGGSVVARRLNWAIAENKVIHAPFYPVGVCVVETNGEKEGAFSDPVACAASAREFIALASSSNKAAPASFPGYGFWNWDQSKEEFWQVLYDTAVFEAPSAASPAMALAAHEAGPSDPAGEAATENCLIYEQSTGQMFVREDGKFDLIGRGYSGSLSGGGRNDASKQCVKDIGPLPRGRYTIGTPTTGPSPYSLPLTPDPTNNMCGRSAFLIHGDSISHPGNASDGCIILSRPEREAIVNTRLRTLVVTDVLSSSS
jgi:kumamolisin